MPLPNETQALNLATGWTCWLELTNDDGMCSGKAELREERETRCALVLAQKPTLEEVLSRLQQRADHYRGVAGSNRYRLGSIFGEATRIGRSFSHSLQCALPH